MQSILALILGLLALYVLFKIGQIAMKVLLGLVVVAAAAFLLARAFDLPIERFLPWRVAPTPAAEGGSAALSPAAGRGGAPRGHARE